MPGTFSKANRPQRPGAYFNWRTAQPVSIASPLSGVVAVPFTHDWGPLEETVRVNSFAEFQQVFGNSTDTDGYMSVLQAFEGENVENRGGAGEVVCYRAGSDDADSAARTIDNTGAADALTVTARYPGTKGNDLYTQVIETPGDNTSNDLIVLLGTTEVERYTHTKADIAGVAAAINASSNWISATVVLGTTALAADGSPVALTGGDDGEVLVSGDWSDARDALEVERFSVAVCNSDDDSIITAFATWCTDLNASGKRFILVVGGADDETAQDALDRASGIDDPNVVTLGLGTYSDESIVDVNGDPVVLSSAQLAPRIAGIVAARGERQSVSFARLGGLSIVSGATDAEILDFLGGGVLAIAQDSHVTSPVRLERGITTYVSDTTDTPNEIYSQIKFVRTMHGVEMELTEFAEQNVVGQLPVNNSTREYLVGEMQAQLNRRIADSVIQPGAQVTIDIEPPPSDDQDFIQLAYVVKFGRSLEQVYNTVYVG